ncbi:uncharacterized protein [Medicago truncatula]|uniref:uncharacterized protein n=1 Tax=Medicago truncatula TaxID=3880 RepID=UPI000D2F3896|nr:uncharacterized protein LOC11413376 [Medicago truncatula]
MDDGRGPPKRIRGNHQSPNTLASSSISPPNEVAMGGNVTLPSQIHLLNQVEQLGNSWSRPGRSLMVNNENNHLIPENNLVQHFQPTLHIQASHTNESSLESGNGNVLRFHHHRPLGNQQHNVNHRPTLPMHGVQPNPPLGGAIPLQPGLHILESRGVMSENTLRHQSVHPFGSSQDDEDISLNEEMENLLDDIAFNDEVQNLLDGIYLDDEEENLIDPHLGMRLEIEGMSYEEFIALGERIGNVSIGLSKEAITTQLKTKIYTPYPNGINLEELPSDNKEIDSCTICQTEFEDHEKIGILQCKHEYHVECIQNWTMGMNSLNFPPYVL